MNASTASGRAPAAVRRVGVVEPMNVGDLLCSVPLYRSLRHAFPAAEIVLVGDSYVRPLARHLPYVDRFVEVDVDPLWGPEEDMRRFVDCLRQLDCDLLLKLYGWLGIRPETSFFDEHLAGGGTAIAADRRVSAEAYWRAHVRSLEVACAVGAPWTAGLAETGAQAPCAFAGVPYRRDAHVVTTMHDLADALGLEWRGDDLEIRLDDDDEREAERLLREAGADGRGPLVGVHPGASVRFRRWPPERFAEVADLLVARHGATILVTGVADEAGLAAEVIACMAHADRAVNLAGRTSLGGFAALVRRMTLIVTNDTGSVHLAVATRTPSVVVFGLASEATQWSVPDPALQRAILAPDGGQGPSHGDAVRTVAVEDVARAATQFLVRQEVP